MRGKYILVGFSIFFITLLMRSTIDDSYYSIYSVIEIAIPYRDGSDNLLFFAMFLNLLLVYLCLYPIFAWFNQFFRATTYFKIRVEKNSRLYYIYLKKLLSESLTISIIYLLISILFMIFDLNNFDLVIQLTLSVFLTILIWGNILFLLKMFYPAFKETLLVVIVGIFLAQYLSREFFAFSTLIIGHISFFQYTETILSLKVLSLILLLITNLIMIERYEIYGKIND